MSRKARARLHEHGGAANLYIPKEIVRDSTFPFAPERWRDLVIEIQGRALIVRERQEGER